MVPDVVRSAASLLWFLSAPSRTSYIESGEFEAITLLVVSAPDSGDLSSNLYRPTGHRARQTRDPAYNLEVRETL